jgi:FMN phosphatase YigB (HAD superfamily)
MSQPRVVFLFDVDNTLIDNDRVIVDVARRYPADRYVLIDDKVRILTAVKKVWGDRLTTVFPRQGPCAHAPMDDPDQR